MRSLILFLTLTTAATSAAHAEPATRAERAWIVDYFTHSFRDPYSLRSTGISEVRPLTGARGTIPAGICVRYNARNALGGYEGVDWLVFVRTPSGLAYGDWRQNVSTATCRDDGVSYAPFPELAAIR